jgi:SAM-dependent methyltransferase
MDATPTSPERCECLLCGVKGETVAHFETSVTSEAKVLPRRSTLYACPRCGHLFTSIELDLHDYYRTAYDATLTDDGQDELVALAGGGTALRTDVDYELMRRMLAGRIQPGSRVFEYGCGRGRILSRLAKDGFANLRAHDVSERYRAPVETIIGRGRLQVGERPAPHPVDLVCSFFVLEHDVRPGSALAYMRAHLGPDGHLFLMVPNYATNVGDLACADHVNHFSAASIARLLRGSGFEVVAVDEASAIGSVAVLARPGPVVAPPVDMHPPRQPGRTAHDFVDYVGRLDALLDGLDEQRPVFIYGAGFYGALAVAHLRDRGRKAAGLFDANPRKHGTLRHGLRVEAPPSFSPGTANRREDVLLVSVNPDIARPIADRFRPLFASVLVA